MDKVYLGDGCYAQYDGWMIRVFASNGMEDTNEVFLEPEVAKNLIQFVKKVMPHIKFD